MRRCALVAVAFVAFATRVSRAQRPTDDDSAVVARIVQTETQFFKAWRDAWRDTLGKLAPKWDLDEDAIRTNELLKNDLNGFHELMQSRCPNGLDLSMIPSMANGQAVCAWWEFRGHRSAVVFPVHAAVRAALKGTVLSQRRALVALLDTAAQLFPTNAWVTGQRVRFLVDDRDFAGALAAVRGCTAGRWWCSALGGYVLSQRGSLGAADSAFQTATAATTGQARCDWTDMTVLMGEWKGEFNKVGFVALDTKPRTTYGKLPCAQRDSLSSIAFWLADPFWSDAVNERRVEQYVRKVSLLLHNSVAQDELYNWQPMYGGDALEEMVLRYGWPSQVMWAGPSNDDAEARRLHSIGKNTLAGTPYLSANYDHAQVRLIPTWSALTDPFKASSADLGYTPAPNYPWAGEFMPSRTIAAITSSQTAFLRRQANVLFVYAADFSEVSLRYGSNTTLPGVLPLRDSMVAVVMRSTGPDSIQRLGTGRVDRAAQLFVRQPMPSAPAILSIEIPNNGEAFAARARFPVTPPKTFAQMAPGEQAISDPVILQPYAGEGVLPNDPEGALARTLGTTRFSHARKTIGVYWETYGFAPGDSVEITVQVQRYTSQNLLARAAVALFLLGDKNATVSMAWTEPRPGHSSHVTDGPVPIISRSLVLNIASLPTGEYWLDVGVRKPGSAPVVGRRSFIVQ